MAQSPRIRVGGSRGPASDSHGLWLLTPQTRNDIHGLQPLPGSVGPFVRRGASAAEPVAEVEERPLENEVRSHRGRDGKQEVLRKGTYPRAGIAVQENL